MLEPQENLFPILFPTSPPFPIPAFQSFLAFVSLLPKGKPGLPTGEKELQFAQGQGVSDGSVGTWESKGRVDSSLLSG